MEFYILNTAKKIVGVLDYFQSAIWTPRYYDVGDFEIQIPASADAVNLLREDYLVTRLDDDMVGIVERVKLVTDGEDGEYILVSGRDAKSILERRIVWKQTMLSGTVEDGIRRLITENVISPSDDARRIPNFVLGDHKGFSEEIRMQVTGDNLLEVITKICQTYSMGFKVRVIDGTFVFDLYKGVNRSDDQNETPRVKFSPEFDNVVTVEYESDTSNLKNVALIAGEGEGADRKTVSIGESSGLLRREIYVDARDISSNNGTIDPTSYNAMLSERGSEKLSEYGVITSFFGQVEPSVNYEYKKDYFLGDVVQIENEYGVSAASRVIEMIECEDASGYSITPTFEEVPLSELILIGTVVDSPYFIVTEDDEIINIMNIVESEDEMTRETFLLTT